MKVLLVGLLLLSTFSSFAQTSVRKIKAYECVLETAGKIEISSVLRYYGEQWEPVSEDLISAGRTKIGAMAALKNKCLLKDELKMVRIIGTATPLIESNADLKLLQNNLKVCNQLLTENLKCEASIEIVEIN